ncbi:deaminase domain-containing protein [Bacillus sp. FJAT-51639]|uniref:Deaminase domain-containing protein n=1 Tax=Bacillus bruguierae TaxID=3127667 RepID=A0ABU8FL76_9BACI
MLRAQNPSFLFFCMFKIRPTGGSGARFPTRIVNPETEGHILDKVSEARGGLSNRFKETGNFAYAEVDVIGINKSEFYSHSGIHDPAKKIPGTENFSFKPENPIFKATEAPNSNGGKPYLRDADTEYKILNDIANQLGDNVNAQGRIKLFTEKDTCSSCNGVINHFKIKYPKIEIKVVHNNGNMISP